MKLNFLSGLGGKGKAEESKGRGYIPADRVRDLMGRGFSEIDTIDVLRREGFSPDEIDKGLTNAIKQGMNGSSNGAYPEEYANYNAGQQQQQQPQMPQMEMTGGASDAFQKYQESVSGGGPQQFSQPVQQAPQMQQQQTPSFPPRNDNSSSGSNSGSGSGSGAGGLHLPTMDDLQPSKAEMPVVPESPLPDEYYQGYQTEEYIDFVVQERTKELMEKMREIAGHNKELDGNVKLMTDRVGELSKTRFEQQQQVSSSIDELTESVKEVNMRIAGLEKAFKETLPALIESVRALSDLAQRFRREA
jgi:hypothetical protein